MKFSFRSLSFFPKRYSLVYGCTTLGGNNSSMGLIPNNALFCVWRGRTSSVLPAEYIDVSAMGPALGKKTGMSIGRGGYWSDVTVRGSWTTPMVQKCSTEQRTAMSEIRTRESRERIRSTPPQDGVYFKNSNADINYMVQTFTAIELAAGCRSYDHLLQTQAYRHRGGGMSNYCDMARLFCRYKKCATNRSFMMPILDSGLAVEGPLRLCGIRYRSREEDIEFMINKYPAPELARGIRARAEHTQYCAKLFGDPTATEILTEALSPFEATNIMAKRSKHHKVDFSRPLEGCDRRLICKVLTDDASRLGLPYLHRAAVVLAICHVEGIPSLLFQVRSDFVSYPNDVCVPGGKHEFHTDKSIIQTGVREMEEEISGLPHNTEPIAALRCPWEELQALTCGSYAVTPVVAYIGEIGEHHLKPATPEVKELFTIPLTDFLNDENWSRDRLGKAPVFGGGPREIWGLTGYIVNHFTQKLKHLDINQSSNKLTEDAEGEEETDELNDRPNPQACGH